MSVVSGVTVFLELTWGSINFFQRNYPYVWAGARVVRDI